jgi:transposase
MRKSNRLWVSRSGRESLSNFVVEGLGLFFYLITKKVLFGMRFFFDYKDVFTQHPTRRAAISYSSPAQEVENSTQEPKIERSESGVANEPHLNTVPATSSALACTQQTGAPASVSSAASHSNTEVVATNGSKTDPVVGSTSKKNRGKNAVAFNKILVNTSDSSEAKTKHPGGRPTKRTPEITARIVEAISYGLTDEEAAALVGIDDDTLTQWRKIPEFSGAIKTAVATRQLTRLKRIDAGEPGWQGTAWAMERQYPERFARPEVQFNLASSSTNSRKQDDFSIRLQKSEPIIRAIVDSQPEEITDPSG